MSTKSNAQEADFSNMTKEQLIADFKVVLSDADALVRATANQGGDALAAVRAKTEASLTVAKAKMADIQAQVITRTKEAAKATDAYVHENPWQAIGISAGIGIAIGFLMGRR